MDIVVSFFHFTFLTFLSVLSLPALSKSFYILLFFLHSPPVLFIPLLIHISRRILGLPRLLSPLFYRHPIFLPVFIFFKKNHITGLFQLTTYQLLRKTVLHFNLLLTNFFLKLFSTPTSTLSSSNRLFHSTNTSCPVVFTHLYIILLFLLVTSSQNNIAPPRYTTLPRCFS